LLPIAVIFAAPRGGQGEERFCGVSVTSLAFLTTHP